MNLWDKLLGRNKKTIEEFPAARPLENNDQQNNLNTESTIIEAETEKIKITEPSIEEVTPQTKTMKEYEYPQIGIFKDNQQTSIAGLINHGKAFSLDVIWSIENEITIYKDLVEVKNIFITGAQAVGKTNFIHQLIISLLVKKHPSQLKFALIDVKGLELTVYEKLNKQFLAKLPESPFAIVRDVQNAVHTLNALCIEMDNRVDLLKDAGVRQFAEYNNKIIERQLNPQKGHQYLPSIVLAIDDLAPCLLFNSREILMPLERLLNSGYRIGIYIIICTNQYAGIIPQSFIDLFSQKVIFRINNKEDHRRFFDTVKVNRFLNEGEFLYNEGHPIHEGKSVFFDYPTIEKLIDQICDEPKYPQPFLLPEYIDENALELKEVYLNDKDPLFEDAARLIVASQLGSTSLLQRRMKLGYNRVGRLMDQLEAAGIVGTNQGSKTRDVLIKTETDLQRLFDSIIKR